MIVTILYFIFRNEYFVTFIVVLISIATLFINYAFTKKIFGVKAALLACLLLTVNFDLIYYSVDIPHPLVTLSLLLSFSFLISAKKDNKPRFLIFSFFFFLLGMMYITSYLLIPIYLLYFLSIFYSLIKKFGNKIFLFLIQVILMSIFNFLSVIYFHFFNNFKEFENLNAILTGQDNYLRFNLNSLISSIVLNLETFSGGIFLSERSVVNMMLLTLFIFLFFLTILRKTENSAYQLFIGFAILSGILFSALNPNSVDLPHLLVFIPLFIILIAISSTFFLQTFKSRIFLVPVFIILMIYIFNNQKNFIWNLFAKSRLKNHQQKVAEFINNTVQKEPYSLLTITPQDKSGYYSLEYIYALKKLPVYHMPVRMDLRGELHYSFNSQKGNIFLICKNFIDEAGIINNCLNFFREKYGQKQYDLRKVVDNAEIFLFTNKI